VLHAIRMLRAPRKFMNFPASSGIEFLEAIHHPEEETR